MVGKITTPPVSEIPDLIEFWDFGRNIPLGLDPSRVTVGSAYKCWFKCRDIPNHSFIARPREIIRGRGCGVCRGFQLHRGFNDFESCLPYESYFWDYDANRCNPWEIIKSSHEKFWFICEVGHSFYTALSKVYSGRWCSYCSGHRVISGENDLATTHPDIASQIDPSSGIDPTTIKSYSNHRVPWICLNDPSHRWTAIVANRTKRGDGCAVCGQALKRSKMEVEIFNWIDSTLLPGLEVVPNDKTVLDGKHIDIYIPSLRIGFEYNGNYWHRDKGDPEGPSAFKEKLAKSKGIRLYTIWEDDWANDRTTWENFIVRCINLTGP